MERKNAVYTLDLMIKKILCKLQICNDVILNLYKCDTITFSLSRITVSIIYIVNDVVLERLDSINVIFNRKMSFNEHIHRIVNKSLQVFNLIKRTCKEMKSIQRLMTLYPSLVWLNLMISSCVLSPYFHEYIKHLEFFRIWNSSELRHHDYHFVERVYSEIVSKLLIPCSKTSREFNDILPWCIFTCEKVTAKVVAKDIQSLCRYLRKIKDVFKELRVLVKKGKVALHKLTKIYWKQYLQVQASFNITILVTTL